MPSKPLKETTSMLIEKMEYTTYQAFIQECKEKDCERGHLIKLVYDTYQEYEQMLEEKNDLLNRVAKKNELLVKDVQHWKDKFEMLEQDNKDNGRD